MRRASSLATLVGPAILAGLVVAVPPPAAALIPELSPEEVEAAVEAGSRSIADPEFEEEWRVPLPEGGEILVTTPFARLARAARRAALRGEALADRERQEQLDRGRGRLELLVSMLGDALDFARFYRPRLQLDGREVKVTFTQNERTARRLPDGRFAARNLYVFPLEGLPAQGAVTLVVESAVDDREVLRVTVDLARLR